MRLSVGTVSHSVQTRINPWTDTKEGGEPRVLPDVTTCYEGWVVVDVAWKNEHEPVPFPRKSSSPDGNVDLSDRRSLGLAGTGLTGGRA